MLISTPTNPDMKIWVGPRPWSPAPVSPEEQQKRDREAREKRLLELVGPRHAHCTFANFKISHPSQEQAMQTVQDGWYHQCTTLLLTGLSGVGKTHLAVASMRFIMQAGDFAPVFVNEADLLADWRSAAANRSKFDWIERLRTGQAVFIDDLGTARYTDGGLELLYQVIDYRYRHDLRTMFTTNYSLAVLAQRIGDKLVSRIADRSSSKVLKMEGPNYRIQEAA